MALSSVAIQSPEVDLAERFRPPGTPSAQLKFGFLLVTFVTLAIRLIAVANTDVIQRDGVTFIRMARTLLVDPGAAIRGFNQHAGYPALIALVHPLFGGGNIEGWEHAGQAISVVAGTLATLGVWALAGLALDWRIAWISALLFAVGRKWTMLGADVMSDATSLALFIWSIVLGVLAAKAIKSSRGVFLAGAAGVLAGGAYLVRPEGMGGAIVVVGMLGVMALSRRIAAGRASAMAAACIVMALLVALPYMIAIGGVTKKNVQVIPVAMGSFGGSGPVLAVAMPVEISGPVAMPTALPMAVVKGPASDRPAWRAVIEQTIEAMQPAVFVLFTVWCVSAMYHFAIPVRMRKPFLRLPHGPGGIAMGMVLLLYVPLALRLHATAGYLDWRHVMAIAFVLAALSGAGLVSLVEFVVFATTRSDRPAGWRVAKQWIWLLPLLVGVAGYRSIGPLHGGKTYIKETAEELRKMSGPGDFTVSNLSLILHYSQAKGKTVDTSSISGPAFIETLRHFNPRPTRLAISERWLAETEPSLLTYLEPPVFEQVVEKHQNSLPHGTESDVMRLYVLHWDAPTSLPATRPAASPATRASP